MSRDTGLLSGKLPGDLWKWERSVQMERELEREGLGGGDS